MNYSKIVLSGAFRETESQTRGILSAAERGGFRFDLFYVKIETLIRHKKVKRILIECRLDFSTGLFAGLEEIRERLKRLVDSGKNVYFYSPLYGAAQLFLASACTTILIHPMGSLRFSGLSWSFTFFKRLMRSFGVDAEIIRRGDYKSAGDRFRTEHLDEAARLQYESYIAAVMKELKENILSGCKKTEKELDALLEGRILDAEKALDEGWIDEISTVGDLENRWKEEKVKEVKLKKDVQHIKKGFSLKRSRIAVLVFEGAVIDGHTKRDPMLGQAVGAASFIPSIRKLRDDKKVKAVVFRINSGGGSAFASEDITNELRELSKKKPVFVSMSEVAGSGGYWMSCCGSRTFALPTTLTGSIGVISIYLSWYKLLERLGITHDTIKEGEYADTGSPLRPLSPEERRIIDAEIASMYEKFLKIVSGFREISLEEADSLGGGRVWSGSDAAANRLVDASGGLSDALRAAEEASELKNASVRFYPEVKRGIIEKLLTRRPGEDEESVETLQAGAEFGTLLKMLQKGIPGAAAGPCAIMEEVLFKWK